MSVHAVALYTIVPAVVQVTSLELTFSIVQVVSSLRLQFSQPLVAVQLAPSAFALLQLNTAFVYA